MSATVLYSYNLQVDTTELLC